MGGYGFGQLVIRGRIARMESTRARARAVTLCAALERFGSPRARPTALGSATTDGSGVIVRATEAAARWLNVPADHLVGMRLLHFVSRRDTRGFRAMVKRLGYAGGSSQQMAVRFRPRHGRPELVLASVERTAPNTFEWTLRGVTPAQPDSATERGVSR